MLEDVSLIVVGSTLYSKGTHNMILDWWLGRWSVEGESSAWGFFRVGAFSLHLQADEVLPSSVNLCRGVLSLFME